MAKITTLFWDIGGVILTNGWDRGSRREAATAFNFDYEEFQDRHDLSFPAFDSGQITLNEYLDRTLFYRTRSFTREEFTAFMFAQSKEYPETRAVLADAARTGKYFIGSINNEPFELNQYRIEAFNLAPRFSRLLQLVLCSLAQTRRDHLPHCSRSHATPAGAMCLHRRPAAQSGKSPPFGV